MSVSYLLFVDESGHDQRESPYEVLAGLAIEDRDLWNLISAIDQVQERFFGLRYASLGREIKGKHFLTRKIFRVASQLPPFDPEDRSRLAAQCLIRGAEADRNQITALAQAKIVFVKEALQLCAAHRARAFASITVAGAPRPEQTFLRKDYAYLFERFYYFLEDSPTSPMGIVVFDELERAQSHLLIGQMSRYFQQTGRGRMRSSRIIPQPLFVHSELTTLVQIVDLLAYIVAWGVKVGGMDRPRREELAELANLVCDLRYRAVRDVAGNSNFVVWSFAVITDLRPRLEQGGSLAEN
jgi:hypothetical protein